MKRLLIFASLILLVPIFPATGEERTPASIFAELHTRKGRAAGSLEEMVQKRQIPGVSIAVIRDFKLDWTHTLGVANVESKRPVDADTLFQAASISKPVGAAVAHLLAEQGKLDLDAPIAGYLMSWQVPAYDFPGTPPITARLLMSHRAGATVHGFDGCDVGVPVPTIVQVLNGDSPCHAVGVSIGLPPGQQFKYSGGGISILQLAVMDLTQQSAEDLAKERVFDPLGMTRSTFAQPLPERLRENAATAYKVDGSAVPGGGKVHPELYAAGMWTTPSDLCRFGIGIQEGLRGSGDSKFSNEMATSMTTMMADGPTSPGFFIEGNYFLHNGGNVGMKCLLKAHKSSGYGFAIMCNSDDGQALQFFVFNALADAYGWEK